MNDFIPNPMPICETLNESVRKEWVSALRSGKYGQGKQALRKIFTVSEDGDYDMHYCCLGVLADITDNDWRESTDDAERFQSHLTNGTNFLSTEFAESIELDYCDQRILASMNDAGVDFRDIADMIERGEILFTGHGDIELMYSAYEDAITDECNYDTLDSIRFEYMEGQ